MFFRNALVIIAQMIVLSSLAQAQDDFQDSLVALSFEKFVGQVLSTPRDTVAVDFEQKYELLFSANCRFTETILSSTDGVYRPYTSTSGATIFAPETRRPQEPSDSAIIAEAPFALDFTISEIHPVYGCAEYVRERSDSISYSFQFHNEEGLVSYRLVPTIPSFFSSGYFGVLSYGNGEYVIAERSMIMNIGSQTSTGTTETLYFRKREE